MDNQNETDKTETTTHDIKGLLGIIQKSRYEWKLCSNLECGITNGIRKLRLVK